MSDLSFSQTYILASKVRSKLTKEAASPKASLRHLVVQANMLDNIMDYISEETEKRTIQQRQNSKLQIQQQEVPKVQAHVTFKVPIKPVNHTNTSVTEYELGDSDPDSEDDEDVEQFSPLIFRPPQSIVEEQEEDEDDFTSSESDSDEYYYYSDSDEVEEDEEEEQSQIVKKVSPPAPIFRELPVMNLTAIDEEEEDEDSYSSDSESEESIISLPEFSDSYSLSDAEVEVHDVNEKAYPLSKSMTKNKFYMNQVENKQQFPLFSTSGTIALEHVF
ncbi:hypothetical protein JA1_004872 [Spathaspora sp. JA1]|nr:hypothetical protein JA1_004872 [Spathaspora sp. JA1]